MVRTRSATGMLPSPKRADLDGVASDPDDSHLEERPNKRARTRRSTQESEETVDGQLDSACETSSSAVVKSVRRRLAGRLANMMSMPLDVFCEIAHYLGPDDLLRLSRSSKALRELLLSKSSKSIWRAAEEAVGLPRCPEDLSSPQYASLVFDTFCTHCFYTRAYKHELSLRVRLCLKCSKKHLNLGRVIIDRAELPEEYDIAEVYYLSPTSTYSDVFQDTPTTEYFSWHDKYYEPHFRTILDKYRSFKASSDAQKDFVKERRKTICQIWPGIKALDHWIRQANTVKARGRFDAKMSRRISIFDKLKELGYTNEDLSNTTHDEKDWRWNDLIKQPRPLTDRVWSNIRPHLEETIRLRRIKIARITKERRAEERREKLLKLATPFIIEEELCCIGVSEFLELPLSHNIVHSDEAWTDSLQKHWDSLKQDILDFSKSRRQEFTEKAASKMISARRESGLHLDVIASVPSQDGLKHGSIDNIDILQHPTSFFKRAIWLGSSSHNLSDFSSLMWSVRKSCLEEFHPTGYPNMKICLLPDLDKAEGYVLSIANTLYASVGVASTMDEMEALGESFICMRCHPSRRKHLSWERLVGHYFRILEDFPSERIWRSTDISDHDLTLSGEVAMRCGHKDVTYGGSVVCDKFWPVNSSEEHSV